MKKIFVTMAAALLAVTMNAQNKIGELSIAPTIGLNSATLSGDGVTEAKAMMTFAVGANFEYGVSKDFGVTAGLIYSMQGAQVKGADVKEKLNYLNVPILANYYVAKGLALKAGIQPGILLSANMEASGGGTTGSVDIKEECSNIDFTIPVGASYEISNFVIDARYNIGLTNIYDSGDPVKNSVVQIAIGYKFSLK